MSLDLLVDDKCVDNKRLVRQLIVVGNGLDLYCGLASSFGSFFGPRREMLRSVEYRALHGITGWEDYLIDNKLTVWDIVLYIWAADDVKSRNWSDIEAAIADWVTPQVFVKDKIYVVENKHLKKVLGHLNATSVLYGSTVRFSEQEVALFLKYIYGQGPWEHAELLDSLLEELHKLEDEFTRYLSDKVEGTEGYSDKLSRVLHGVVFDEPGMGQTQKLESSILNFNYTTPSAFFRSEGFDVIDHYVNIHGNLHNEIVIGIDATGHMDDPSVAQFTKTYRVMGIGSSAVKGLVYPGQGVDSGPRTVLIKFVGHSLNEADYSYFQSLFDTVDLYGGETRLVFYYAPHGGDSFASACNHSKESVMDGVIKLLTKYGETLDNTDHGKNLVHKLLLEGRLAVKLIPEAEAMWEGADKAQD